jgi:hypothetical protein
MRILPFSLPSTAPPHCQHSAHQPAHWSVESWQAPVLFRNHRLSRRFLPFSPRLTWFVRCRAPRRRWLARHRPPRSWSVLAPIDNEAWLPRGLARQLREWLERQGVACATPKPLCSLTPQDYALTRQQRISYQDLLIAEFAAYFGQPELSLTIDPNSHLITVSRQRNGAWLRSFVAEIARCLS